MNNNTTDADKLWEFAWTYIRTVVDTLREPFLILDKDLRVISANRTFYASFQVVPEDTEGKLIYELGNGQWDIPKLKILLEDILPKHTHFEDFKVEHEFPKIGRKIMVLNARQIFSADQKEPIMLLAVEDITKQVELEEKLRAYTKELSIEVARKTGELEERIRQLEQLNTVMVGREVKMVELKRENQAFKDADTSENSKK